MKLMQKMTCRREVTLACNYKMGHVLNHHYGLLEYITLYIYPLLTPCLLRLSNLFNLHWISFDPTYSLTPRVESYAHFPPLFFPLSVSHVALFPTWTCSI